MHSFPLQFFFMLHMLFIQPNSQWLQILNFTFDIEVVGGNNSCHKMAHFWLMLVNEICRFFEKAERTSNCAYTHKKLSRKLAVRNKNTI